MKTDWDYTLLADAYLKRPDYADAAIDALLAIAGTAPGDPACDIGAGVAHLTLMLADNGLQVVAVEPNDAMRANGMDRTRHLSNVEWSEGTGEASGQPDRAFGLVSFGSSFNVCDRPRALVESARILRPRGWFACLWNYRHLDDPIQAGIEAIIQARVPAYHYGSRREDQTAVIDASGQFGPVIHLDAKVEHTQSVADCVEAWRSHATLQRQSGASFPRVLAAIEAYLLELEQDPIQIPYTTHVWMAQAG